MNRSRMWPAEVGNVDFGSWAAIAVTAYVVHKAIKSGRSVTPLVISASFQQQTRLAYSGNGYGRRIRT
jgi:hypothetical protein